jgi:hypothetical protein
MDKDFDREVAVLLEAAMKQPGVADVMKIYEINKMAIDPLQDIQRALEPRVVISTSTTSGFMR